jgi:hypothetical protein
VRRDDSILLGIALENAVLDILTDDALLQKCERMLRESHVGLVSVTMGTFGIYPVTLNLHHDDGVSLFIDGPAFEKNRTQSAAIWVEKAELQRIIAEAMTRS